MVARPASSVGMDRGAVRPASSVGMDRGVVWPASSVGMDQGAARPASPGRSRSGGGAAGADWGAAWPEQPLLSPRRQRPPLSRQARVLCPAKLPSHAREEAERHVLAL
uniref:Uncharacterized protein n=1 Tax=Oryza sativa subsp. japonica TaxID=39947 RepID=Q6Z1P4_ORYSJ|nr:hypothetical protein [Oryza sativa Japonica Group]